MLEGVKMEYIPQDEFPSPAEQDMLNEIKAANEKFENKVRNFILDEAIEACELVIKEYRNSVDSTVPIGGGASRKLMRKMDGARACMEKIKSLKRSS